MRRRNFIHGLLALGAGFTILPGAGRIWKPKSIIIARCEFGQFFTNTPPLFDPMIYTGEWKFEMCDPEHPQNFC